MCSPGHPVDKLHDASRCAEILTTECLAPFVKRQIQKQRTPSYRSSAVDSPSSSKFEMLWCNIVQHLITWNPMLMMNLLMNHLKIWFLNFRALELWVALVSSAELHGAPTRKISIFCQRLLHHNHIIEDGEMWEDLGQPEARKRAFFYAPKSTDVIRFEK